MRECGMQRQKNDGGGSESPVHDVSSCGEVYSRFPSFAKSRPGEICAEHGILIANRECAKLTSRRLIMQKATRKTHPGFRNSFEDHCWEGHHAAGVIELYSNYRREVGVGPSPRSSRSTCTSSSTRADEARAGGDEVLSQLLRRIRLGGDRPTKRLFAAARAAGLPIFILDRDTRPQSQPKKRARDPAPGRAHRSRDVRDPPEFAPHPEDVVITKVRASAFFGTPLPRISPSSA